MRAVRVRNDRFLFLLVTGMVLFGLLMVFSASSFRAELHYKKEAWFFLVRQGVAAVLGMLLLLVLSQIDYKRFQSGAWAFTGLGVMVLSLIAVYFADPVAHRWFRFGPAQIQPAEFAKPAIILFLAWFIAARGPSINHRATFLPAFFTLGTIVGLVALADLGTAAVLGATSAVIFVVKGINLRNSLIALFPALLLVGVAIGSKPYRLNRVLQFFPGIPVVLEKAGLGESLSFARSTSAPSDTSYQATQAKIAVGSGGLLGAGVMNGRQKLLYLPEPHNDFIFAIVGEELGLLGTAGLLFCFLLILWRGYRLFLMAPDDFGRYLALGITTSLVFQAFLNMTVVLGMAPTKGLPLPFISYGGSSLLSSLACVGILLSISERVGWGEMTDE